MTCIEEERVLENLLKHKSNLPLKIIIDVPSLVQRAAGSQILGGLDSLKAFQPIVTNRASGPLFCDRLKAVGEHLTKPSKNTR